MSQEKEKTSFLKKYTWLKWLLLLPFLGIAIYFGINSLPEDFSKSDAFTQYGELNTDSIISPINLDTLVETSALMDTITKDTSKTIDTIRQIEIASLDIDTIGTVPTNIDSIQVEPVAFKDTIRQSPLQDIPLPENREDTVVSSPVAAPSSEPVKEKVIEETIVPTPSISTNPVPVTTSIVSKNSLLNETLFSTATRDTAQINNETFFKNKLISSKVTLKILAIIGKDVLLNGNSADARDIFESIVEEEKVLGLLLSDQNGKIIYASNAKFLQENIKNILPELNINEPTVAWIVGEGRMATSMNIYHTYGKIGTIVLLTK